MPNGKPNILILWGDDIGWYNISHNNRGAMGYQTPNIDRIAREGIEFTDYYGQQSCTAGRAAFITGQNPVRTGLTKVGCPGANLGLQPEDPTIAELLKPHGYVTGQFGKNHFGDLNKYVPTVHGFDEFFGNMYHLNAEEEPEVPDYPKDPRFKAVFGPRGVLDCKALDVQDPTVDPRWGPVGKQTIVDTGPLTRKRMETIDDDVTARTIEFIKKAHAEGKPFFVWWNSTHMHLYTHIPKEAEGISGQGFYNDAMVLHDRAVGQLLDLLDELGIAEDTIVQYSTDNGPHYNTWPDGAISPWRSEKNTNWEGGYRVPCFARWPGKFEAGKVLNGIVTHQEWLPTLLAAAGEPDIVEKLLKGHQAGEKSFRVHIDGYNILPYLTGETDKCPRSYFFYVDDDGECTGFRFGDWKIVLLEQRAKTMQVWTEPFVQLRIPKIFNLRRDPFERADENSNGYWNWVLEHFYIVPAAAVFITRQLQTFKEFPPRQEAPSFDIEKIIAKMNKAADGSMH
ncbi:MAG: arylsulfatase [Anaerolineae bacterium]|jgi:arylsulfatase|nr:arylsulfatase [Anaerolineae bacterium]MDX9831146.1 arylsulfatase [Anaerolineae bacterium]